MLVTIDCLQDLAENKSPFFRLPENIKKFFVILEYKKINCYSNNAFQIQALDKNTKMQFVSFCDSLIYLLKETSTWNYHCFSTIHLSDFTISNTILVYCRSCILINLIWISSGRALGKWNNMVYRKKMLLIFLFWTQAIFNYKSGDVSEKNQVHF